MLLGGLRVWHCILGFGGFQDSGYGLELSVHRPSGREAMASESGNMETLNPKPLNPKP